MSRDPYAPPTANVQVPDARRGSAVKAVVVGLGVDIGATIVFSFVASIAYGAYLGATGAAPGEMEKAMASMSYDSPLGILLTMAGCLFSVLGGYLCARIARHSEYKLGLIMCAASLVMVALTGGAGEGMHAAVMALLVLASLAATMVGIHLGVRRNRSGR